MFQGPLRIYFNSINFGFLTAGISWRSCNNRPVWDSTARAMPKSTVRPAGTSTGSTSGSTSRLLLKRASSSSPARRRSLCQLNSGTVVSSTRYIQSSSIRRNQRIIQKMNFNNMNHLKFIFSVTYVYVFIFLVQLGKHPCSNHLRATIQRRRLAHFGGCATGRKRQTHCNFFWRKNSIILTE